MQAVRHLVIQMIFVLQERIMLLSILMKVMNTLIRLKKKLQWHMK
ncbi:hypothetical protein HMPREF9413_4489 [Paenibacillus sp. HGF7]|nr:hypothetical protein HMPREF9413_4489 [Paenibacillus sp. HGF7]